MSSHTIVSTDKAPSAYPTLSQATVHNGVVYCAGALGNDPTTKALVEGTIADRTVRTCTFRQLDLSVGID